jgi:hypothetical protein
LKTFGQQLLLHTESADGAVLPIWEDVEPDQVVAPKEMMSRQHVSTGIPLQYHRIPITSETPPDFSDISDLMDVVLRSGTEKGAIVVNCQLGRGRSTLTSASVNRYPLIKQLNRSKSQIIILLIQHWLQSAAPTTPARLARSQSRFSIAESDHDTAPRRQSYQVINSERIPYLDS